MTTKTGSHDPAPTGEAVLAMDAGQTGVRVQLRHGTQIVHEQEFPGVITDRPVVPQLAQFALQALHDAAPGGDAPRVLAVGSSGLTGTESAGELKELVAAAGLERVLLAHDSTTSYLGALGDTTGAVVAAGTGVVTLAVGREAVARVDGWGNLIGDAGSGYWIGRAGLDAVMRAHDGRGPATALTAPVLQDFDGDLDGAYMVLQADEQRVRRIAAWARTVATLAEEGDEVCRRICLRAGEELATSVVAGLRRVGEDSSAQPRVSTLGKVFDSPVIKESFAAQLWQHLDDVCLVEPLGTSIDGAALLPRVSRTSALSTRVDVA
ncbi:N-acetylglucosamine kinase [Luteococcus sp. OSA5]|uniref:N-acetylglucosamine kinase n=1 Tax=Luteococcus sp. OSA5 TaxID=3401630 RepID=UPI003B434F66